MKDDNNDDELVEYMEFVESKLDILTERYYVIQELRKQEALDIKALKNQVRSLENQLR